MNPYKIIETPDEIVSDMAIEIYNYLKLHTNLLTFKKLGWQFFNSKDLLSKSPTVLNFFKNLKLFVKDSAITISVDDTQLPIHIDEQPVIAKINLPILNTKGWANRWYYISKEQLESCPKMLNQFNKEIYNLSGLDTLDVLAELKDMNKPIVFNSSIPHSVNKITDIIVGPRIVASFTFYNEPIKWLE